MQRWIGLGGFGAIVIAVVVWQLADRPTDSYAFKEGPDFARKGYSFDTSHVKITAADGSQTFTVPVPGDPEWEDYLEMKKHREFQSSMDGRDGYAIPYDPEWRTLVRGYRDAPAVDYELVDTFSDLDALAKEVLRAIHDMDSLFLREMHVRMEEFETICWPSFPQSRPYVRIPVHEAWGFHFAGCTSGLTDMLRKYGGQDLVLDEVRVGQRSEYPPNFALLRDLQIVAHEREGGRQVTIENVQSVIERDGRYKVFLYKD